MYETVYNGVHCTLYSVHCLGEWFLVKEWLNEWIFIDFRKKKIIVNVQCTIVYDNVQCTMYSVHCTLYSVQCTLYIVRCTLYPVHCTLYTKCIHCTLRTSGSRLYIGYITLGLNKAIALIRYWRKQFVFISSDLYYFFTIHIHIYVYILGLSHIPTLPYNPYVGPTFLYPLLSWLTQHGHTCLIVEKRRNKKNY